MINGGSDHTHTHTHTHLDVVRDRIREQQRGLEVHLWEYQPQDDRRVRRFSNAVEVGGDAQLGERDGSRAYPLGPVDAEGDGEGVETHLAVALDGLEVVDDGDPEPRDGIEDGAGVLFARRITGLGEKRVREEREGWRLDEVAARSKNRSACDGSVAKNNAALAASRGSDETRVRNRRGGGGGTEKMKSLKLTG